MTVIVGHRKGFMVADTLSTLGGNWKTPAPTHKIMDYKHTLLGIAGDSGFQQVVHPYLVGCKTPDKLKDVLFEYCQENAQQEYLFVMVNNQNELFYGVGGFYKEISPELDYFAVGSGGDLTQGYLGAIEKLKGDVTVEYTVDAIKHACRFMVT